MKKNIKYILLFIFSLIIFSDNVYAETKTCSYVDGSGSTLYEYTYDTKDGSKVSFKANNENVKCDKPLINGTQYSCTFDSNSKYNFIALQVKDNLSSITTNNGCIDNLYVEVADDRIYMYTYDSPCNVQGINCSLYSVSNPTETDKKKSEQPECSNSVFIDSDKSITQKNLYEYGVYVLTKHNSNGYSSKTKSFFDKKNPVDLKSIINYDFKMKLLGLNESEIIDYQSAYSKINTNLKASTDKCVKNGATSDNIDKCVLDDLNVSYQSVNAYLTAVSDIYLRFISDWQSYVTATYKCKPESDSLLTVCNDDTRCINSRIEKNAKQYVDLWKINTEKIAKQNNVDLSNYIEDTVNSSKDQIKENVEMFVNTYNNEYGNTKKSFKDCDELLGSDLVDLINDIKTMIFIAVPIVIIVLTVIDFSKAIISSDDTAQKKAIKKFIMRLVIGVAIFFVPLIVDIIIGIFNKSGANDVATLAECIF